MALHASIHGSSHSCDDADADVGGNSDEEDDDEEERLKDRREDDDDDDDLALGLALELQFTFIPPVPAPMHAPKKFFPPSRNDSALIPVPVPLP